MCLLFNFDIILNFIIQNLKSKHTSLKKYTNWAKLIYFSLILREREEKKPNILHLYLRLFFKKKSTLQNAIRMTLSPRVFFLPTFLLFSQGNLMPDLHLRFTYISLYWNWTSFVYTGGSQLTKSISTNAVSMSTSMK